MKSLIIVFFAVAIGVNVWLWHSNESLRSEAAALEELQAATAVVHDSSSSQEIRLAIRSADVEGLSKALERASATPDQLVAMLAIASEVSDEERAMLEEAILMKLTATDPQRAAEIALERGAVPALHFALRTWGERNPEAAWAWVHDSEARDQLTEKGALNLLAERREVVLTGIAMNDLGKAMDLISEFDQPGAFWRIAVALEDHHRLSTMKSHLDDLEDNQLREHGMKALATVMALADKTDAIALLEENFSEAERANLAGSLMANIPFHLVEDPRRTADWLNDNADEASRSSYLGAFVSRWTENDFNGVSEWLNLQHKQPWYDEVVTAFVAQAIPADPRSAADWAATISDEALRQRTLKDLVANWPEDGDSSAAEYLSEAGIVLKP